jgi:hypothetical protein
MPLVELAKDLDHEIKLLLELESKLKLQKIYVNKITTTMQVFK